MLSDYGQEMLDRFASGYNELNEKRPMTFRK